MSGNWEVITADEMWARMLQGETFEVPAIDVMFDGERVEFDPTEIESVEYVRDDEVQCIRVEDPDHMYVTDNFVPQRNSASLVYLKSNDEAMIDTLSKLSGTTHRVRVESKQVSRDEAKIWQRNESNVSYTYKAEEEAVLTFNNFLNLPPRNSIVLYASENPIWNHNETILPMSWRLHTNQIRHPGHEYTLQTIPTLSSAIDFDVRLNQPDFQKMLAKRIDQAVKVEQAKQAYKDAYGYSDYDISRLDPDVYSDEIMDLIDSSMIDDYEHGVDPDGTQKSVADNSEDDKEALKFREGWGRDQAEREKKIFAEGQLSRDDLCGRSGVYLGFNDVFIRAYTATRAAFARDSDLFLVKNMDLYLAETGTQFIARVNDEKTAQRIKEAMTDSESNVYGDDVDDVDLTMGGMHVLPAFVKWLSEQKSWDFANGEFDRAVAQILRMEKEM